MLVGLEFVNRQAAKVFDGFATVLFVTVVFSVKISVLGLWAWIAFGLLPIPQWAGSLLMFPAVTVSWMAGGYAAMTVDYAPRG